MKITTGCGWLAGLFALTFTILMLCQAQGQACVGALAGCGLFALAWGIRQDIGT